MWSAIDYLKLAPPTPPPTLGGIQQAVGLQVTLWNVLTFLPREGGTAQGVIISSMASAMLWQHALIQGPY